MNRTKFQLRVAFLCLAFVFICIGCPGPSTNSTPPPITDFTVTPASGLTSSGTQGGPCSPSSVTYTLENTAGTSINWAAGKTQTWVTLSSAGGTLASGAKATVMVSIDDSTAYSLAVGSYNDSVTFTNTTTGSGNTTRPVSLSITKSIACTGLKTFNGGTLADLKALCPSLKFDELEITGGLDLPLDSSTTITANKLTITSSGNISYSYVTCKHLAAPNLTLSVTGDVEIDGPIYLAGENGERIAGSATCKSCEGQNGGDITITGNTIKVTNSITNNGGLGSSVANPYPIGDTSCKAGNSGNLKLAAATSMDLSGARIDNIAGAGPPNGGSGSTIITSGGAFDMRDGNIDSTGAMTFSAATTDIWGTIKYGSLNETIGGAPDTTNPEIGLVRPVATATYGEMIKIHVNAWDVGMGLRGVRLIGLGSDQTYNIADCGPESTLCTLSALISAITMSFPVNSWTSPATLQMIAIDNKGNTTTSTITGILIAYPIEKEPNDSIQQAEVLDIHGAIDGNIQNGDAGSIWQGMLVEDFYKVPCCTSWTLPISSPVNCVGNPNNSQDFCALKCWGFIIDVDFSGSASVNPDIDVYLIDYLYGMVRSSINRNVSLNQYTEGIRAALYDGRCVSDNWSPSIMGTEYFVGVRAWNVPTRANYRIKYDH